MAISYKSTLHDRERLLADVRKLPRKAFCITGSIGQACALLAIGNWSR